MRQWAEVLQAHHHEHHLTACGRHQQASKRCVITLVWSNKLGLTWQQGGQRTGQAPGNLSFLGRTAGDATPVGQRPQQSQFESSFGGDGVGSPTTQTPLHKKLAEMTDQERYGLPGLLSMIPLESPDYSSLAMGQDLTVLGLDLSRPE